MQWRSLWSSSKFMASFMICLSILDFHWAASHGVKRRSTLGVVRTLLWHLLV